MKKSYSLFLGMILTVMSFHSFAESEDPARVVKQTVTAVLSILDNSDLSEEEKRQQVFDIADDRINFKEMSRRVLAINWRKADESQQAVFADRFRLILLHNYWTRIKRYAGEQIEYTAVSYDSTDVATVDTVIVKAGDVRIPISYRMKRIVSVWYAYDFIIENLSLVQSFRNEYTAIIKNHGINGLLEQMEKEVNNYQKN